MKDVLVSWIGGNDLQAHPSHPKHHNGEGPLLSTLKAKKFTHVYLLYNYPDHDVTQYLDWVRKQVNADIVPKYVNLLSPIDFSRSSLVIFSCDPNSTSFAPAYVRHLS